MSAQKIEIKKGDLVEVIAGGGSKGQKIIGKRGKVIVVIPDENRVILENVVMIKRHTKPRSAQKAGGVVEKPRPMDASNVMVVCPECDKKTRIGHTLSEDGKKYIRQCKKCSALLDRKDAKTAKKGAKKAAAGEKKAPAKKKSTSEVKAEAITEAVTTDKEKN